MNNNVDEAEKRFRFYRSLADEFEACLNRVYDLIGGEHRGEIGSHREVLFRDFLRRILPRRFTVSTGFIYTPGGEKSGQLDVIIWDSLNNVALLQQGEFVIVAAESVLAVVEIKSNLGKTELENALTQLHPYMFFDWMYGGRPNPLREDGSAKRTNLPFRGIIGFHNTMKGSKKADPTACFKVITDFYREHYPRDREAIISGHPNFCNMINSICAMDSFFVRQSSLVARRFDGGNLRLPCFKAWKTKFTLPMFCYSLAAHLMGWTHSTLNEVVEALSGKCEPCKPFMCRLEATKNITIERRWDASMEYTAEPPLW